uniref:Calcineurin-like phosphoesterase domain-containing protein n=1 Tax=Zooxanthella nutricula TaxID=1333877 RepID=A0A7S2INV4_9DINO
MFVQTGDVLDRGLEGQRMLKFLWALQDEQPASIILFIGNHEAMLLTREYKYSNSGPSFADKCTYTLDPAGCQAQRSAWRTYTCTDPLGGPAHLDGCVDRAWSGDGLMGRQLLERMRTGQLKMAHLVAGTIFVHAGVTLGALRRLAEAGARPDNYIEVMNALALRAISERRHGDFLLTAEGDGLGAPSKDGPAWTRDFALEDEEQCEGVFDVLKVLGARRMVKGHDPTVKSGTRAIGEAKTLCNGTLFLTDTFMSEGYTGDRKTSEHNLMAGETSTEGDDRRFVYPMRRRNTCSGPL